MSNKKSRYWFMILIFILVGFLYIYPDLRFILELGKDFQGIPLIGAGDETVYLSRIAAVTYRNDLRLANVGTYEHQNGPICQPSLTEVVEGSIGRWLGLEAWQVDIWATFLLPIILCYLIYLLVHTLTGSLKLGILAALVVVVDYYWITSNLKTIFNFSTGYFSRSLLFVRPISPQFHFIPFILSLYFIYRTFLSNNRYYAIFSGLIVGSLFYTTIYYWTFIYAGLGVLSMIELIRGDKIQVKNLLLILFVSLIVSIPYWISFGHLYRLSYFWDIFRRSGGVYTHRPTLPVTELLFLPFFIFLYGIFKIKKDVFYFILSFVLGGLICLNQQIITGKTVEPFHWKIFTNKIFIIISLFVYFLFIFRYIEKVKFCNSIMRFLKNNFIFYTACFSLLVPGFLQQNLYYALRKGHFLELQSMGFVLAYIHKRLPADSVILTDPFYLEDERLISVLTKNYPYISDSFFITSPISDAEIEERYFAALHFYGYSVLEAEGLFRYLNGGLFRGMQVHSLYGGTQTENNAYIEGLKQRYAGFISQNPLHALKKYKVDYILLLKKNNYRILSDVKITKLLNLEYDDNAYVLYKIKDYLQSGRILGTKNE